MGRKHGRGPFFTEPVHCSTITPPLFVCLVACNLPPEYVMAEKEESDEALRCEGPGCSVDTLLVFADSVQCAPGYDGTPNVTNAKCSAPQRINTDQIFNPDQIIERQFEDKESTIKPIFPIQIDFGLGGTFTGVTGCSGLLSSP